MDGALAKYKVAAIKKLTVIAGLDRGQVCPWALLLVPYLHRGCMHHAEAA